MKLLISNKAAMFGGLAAIPFVAAGSYFCMEGFSELFPPHMVVNLIVGYAIFLLGSPITPFGYAMILYVEDAFGTRLTAVQFTCLFSLLFIIQWVIWSQLIAMIWRRIGRKRDLS